MRHPAYMQFDCQEDKEDYEERYVRWKEAKEEREIDLYEERKAGRWDDY